MNGKQPKHNPAKRTRKTNLWALLIGIDKYKAITPLRGCVNDVKALRILLMNRYSVPADQILILTNEEATRANILRTFQEFLIENKDIRRGDQILFHYSGHGSQMRAEPDDHEPDGLNETIVPYDSRTDNVYDIPDKTLAALLNRLAAAKGDQITVILDSCHSGSATRRFRDPSAPRTRRIPSDDRPPPERLDAELRAAQGVRATGPSGWAGADFPYVLLAGCRDREESNEYEGKIEGDTVWHGALTFFMLQELRALPEDTTYAELHERVSPLVNAEYRNQMPQCEGKSGRVIFKGITVQRDPFITVRQVDEAGDSVTLDAGLVHGLRPGTELALYPPNVRTKADLPPKPLANVRVEKVAAITATAVVLDAQAQPIPQFARGVVTTQAYAGLRQTVRLEAGGDDGADAIARLEHVIEQAMADGQPSPYLTLVDDPQSLVDLLVRVEKGKYCIYNDMQELLVDPVAAGADVGEDADKPEVKVRKALESIVRYRTLLKLRNEDANSQLAGKVKMRLRRYVQDGAGAHAEDLQADSVGEGGEITVYYDPENEGASRYVIEVINESKLNIYPHIFTLGPDYAIWQQHPDPQAPTQDTAVKGIPYQVGLQPGTVPIPFFLPEGWDAARDYVKMIVTTEESKLQMLEQGPLDVPIPAKSIRSADRPAIETLLDAVAFGQGTRQSSPRARFAGEDWTVTQLAMNTVRKYQTRTLEAPAGRVSLSEELTLVKPEGFTGEVTVTTLGLATRGASGDPGMKPPPGLDRFRDDFELVGRAGTRSIGSHGLVVALEVDDETRKMISAENPLRLELVTGTRSGADAEELIPVIFDGQDYWLAGYGDDDGRAVEILELPEPVAAADGQAARRGFVRTLRLFIYKRLGRHTPELGLRRAELIDGDAVYAPIERNMFQAGQRVAVLVHGFNGDSKWLVHRVLSFLRDEVGSYDHFLTWDYETYGTSVRDNGEQLTLALRQQCGFGPDDDIALDVFAHSMGCLVSRCMIEFSGGHEFVDRAVLAGPPNRGSTLASTARGFIYLATALINQASVVPLVGMVGGTLKKVYEHGLGSIDLTVDSPVLKELNALDSPSNVPYLVLAGEFRPEETEKNRLQRFAKKFLDRTLENVFREENDMAIGVSSMWGVRGATYPQGGGSYPPLTIKGLICAHGDYFDLPEGREAIKSWLSA